MSERKHPSRHIRANLIAGVLTIIPILVVWVVLDFVFAFLFSVGAPLERALVDLVTQRVPAAGPFLTHPVFEWFIAVVVALALIHTIGAAASHVLGNRLLAFLETLIARIPIIETVYSASKKLIGALQQKPDAAARVVLIDFPYKGAKVVGLVMKTFPDGQTGEEIAAVYVPTTPNPTSGYLELIPVKDVISTDMTMDEAMTMIVSGGAITPDQFSTQRPPDPVKPDPAHE